MSLLPSCAPATMTSTRRLLATALALALLPVTSTAQQLGTGHAQSAPRFLATRGDAGNVQLAHVEDVPALNKRISITGTMTRQQLIDRIAQLSGLRIVYSRDLFDLERTVALEAVDLSVAAVLTETLLGTGADMLLPAPGRIVLVRRVDVAFDRLQVGVISGRVTEQNTRQPVVGARVTVVSTTSGATTNEDGRYTLRGVPAGTFDLEVQRIGFQPVRRSAVVTDNGTTTVDITMVAVPTTLAQVVATATGGQERLKVGNAISSIAADSVVRSGAPVRSVTDLLQGRSPGLQVYFNGGLSGVAAPIRIRGANSFTVSNDPIVIIDGTRVESSGPGASGVLGLRPGRLADLSAEMIESIDVLKGPSASTLYGSDAANGVVVIRTKRGIAGSRRFRMYADQATLTPVDRFKDHMYAYGTSLTTGVIGRCTLAQVSAKACRQDSLVTWNPLENPASTPFADGHRQQYGAQVQGGVQDFDYFLAGDFTSEDGYMRMPDAEQRRLEAARGISRIPDEQVKPNWVRLVSTRANFGSALGPRARIRLANSLVYNRSAVPSPVTMLSSGALTGGAAPTVNGGWFLERPGDYFSIENTDGTRRLTSSVSGDLQPASWLSTRAMIGVDLSNTTFEGLQRNGQGIGAFGGGARQDNRYDVTLYSGDIGATATFPLFSSLLSRTSVGAQYNRRTEFAVLTTGTTLAPGAETLAGAATTTGSENTTETIVAGTYVEQGFEFRDRLFVTGAIRLDGGSAFGADFNTAAYPKASVSWLAGREDDGWTPSWLTTLRVRAAIGASGVQPSAVAARQRDCLASVFVNGVPATGATICQVGNSGLRPERQQEIEAGIDAALFASRVNVELTFYNRESEDAISNIPIAPSVAGLSLTRPMNLGAVRNRGVEFSVAGRAFDMKTVSLDLGINGNVNRNELLTLGPGVTFTPTARHQPGYPIFSQFAFPYTFADADGDGIITASEVTVSTTSKWYGALRPQESVTGTATLGLFNGKLRLYGMVDYRGDFALLDAVRSGNCANSACPQMLDPSSSLADQAAAIAVTKNASANSGFIYPDQHFARLREVGLSLDVPSRFARRVGARGAQVSLSGRNVGLFLTDFPGYTVEAASVVGTQADFGAGGANAPIARTWSLRLSLDY